MRKPSENAVCAKLAEERVKRRTNQGLRAQPYLIILVISDNNISRHW